jgi:hypothetical protein
MAVGGALFQLWACGAGEVSPREPRGVVIARPEGVSPEAVSPDGCALACQSVLRPEETVVGCRVVTLDVQITARLNRTDSKGLLCETR